MELVDTQAGFERSLMLLEGAPRYFIDTEFASSRESCQLCLLQISNGSQVFLIDPIKVRNLKPLGDLLREGEWVLHSGQQDLPLILAAAGLDRPPRLFDTQIAWAMQGPEYNVALAYLQFRIAGLRSNKAHQAEDWTRRPLPPSFLKYAASDVEHLPALYDWLMGRARQLDRVEAVYEASLESLQPEPDPPNPLSIESFRNAWQLEPENQAALQWIIAYANGLSPSQRGELPDEKVLFSIAMRLPRTVDDLLQVRGIPRGWARRTGDWMTQELSLVRQKARAGDYPPLEPPPYATYREIQLDAWLARARAEVVLRAEIAPELALPGRQLKRVKAQFLEGASVPEALRLLGGWRSRVVVPIFEAFAATQPPPGNDRSTP